jgi:site-specific DNA recombinase
MQYQGVTPVVHKRVHGQSSDRLECAPTVRDRARIVCRLEQSYTEIVDFVCDFAYTSLGCGTMISTEGQVMPKAVASTRVSTEDQAESGLGIAAQEAACRLCATRLGLELVSVHADEGVCSVDPIDKRPALLEAIASLGKGDVLIVAKRDRLGRDPIVVAMIEAAIRRRGARVVSAAGEGTESDGPTDILMRRIVDAFGEYERLIIKARTKAALAVKKGRGEKTGGAIPYGSMLGPDKPGPKGVPIKTLVPCPAEQEVLVLMKTLRAGGMTLVEIASELTARGIERREGGTWDHGYISRLLKKTA